MLKPLKRSALRTMKRLGVYQACRDSAWRQRRLLILCYHGISLDDEHQWDPEFYMSPSDFQRRLELLASGGYTVLPLGTAIEQLYSGTLAPRSVCLTFDDGLFDFQERALPLLERFGFPATVYLTTFYSDFNRPVFNPFTQYVMWKSRRDVVDASSLVGRNVNWSLSTAHGRLAALVTLLRYARENGMSASDKDALAARVAALLDVDYQALVERRLLHILNGEEVARLAARGVDFQLHTHRHCNPHDRAGLTREINDNRARMKEILGMAPMDFCYPSGVCREGYPEWLAELGVRSATTADAALASRDSDIMRLPRVVDSTTLDAVEFEGWLTGASAAIPQRRRHVEVD